MTGIDHHVGTGHDRDHDHDQGHVVRDVVIVVVGTQDLGVRIATDGIANAVVVVVMVDIVV
jgi:hypothetical protein